MADIDRPDPGDEVASSWGIQVADRVVARYASVAARDAATPTQEGQVAYVIDIDELQVFDGTVWDAVVQQGQTIVAAQTDAAAPGFTFAGFLDSGMFAFNDGTIGWTKGGVEQFRSGAAGNPGLRLPAGDAANPSLRGIADGDTGFLFGGGGAIGVTNAGVQRLNFKSDRIMELSAVSADAVYMMLWENQENGRRYEWRRSSSFGMLELHAITSGGSRFVSMVISGDDGSVRSPVTVDLTTSNAANMFIKSSDGGFQRSTSSLAYKTSIKGISAKDATAIIKGLKPIRFKSKAEADKEEGKDPNFIGFGAEDVGAVMPEAFSDENYDHRAILAALTKVVQGLM